jgi:flagellar biosynthesis protein FlhB
MAANQGDRTEKPTARRLREARKKGQVARSRDLGQAVSLAAALGALGWYGSALVNGSGIAVRQGLVQAGQMPTRDLRIEDVSPLVFDALRTMAVLVGPLAGAVAVAVVATHTLQGGWVFASESLQPNWSRLSPANNLKRLGPSMAGLDLLKMAVVVAVLTFLAYQVTGHVVQVGGQLARVSPLEAARVGWDDALRLLRLSTVALIAIGVADYGLQRWRLMSTLKMTRQEVKDDFRLTEGNPEIKARVRRVQATMARRRMLTAVPKATVVVTNPTHYAVALEYRRGEMAAPRVLAKGRGFTAARIKEVARAHGVPTVENVPLAQALFKSVEVGDTIPAVLFEAVAEVLAYLIRLKQLAV